MENIEQKLSSLQLPEEQDISHQYRLRRALLHSSYFEESGWHILFDRIRFYATSRRVVATVTITLVVAISGFAHSALETSRTETTDEQVVANTPLENSPQPFLNPSLPGPRSGSEAGNSAVLTASDGSDQDVISVQERPIHLLTLREMTQMLQETFREQDGTVVVETDEGMFLFSFEDQEQDTDQDSTFGITNFQPESFFELPLEQILEAAR